MKLGEGSHVYAIDEGWGKLPEGKEYGLTHGVVVDSLERVHIFNTSRDAVVVFDQQGKFLYSWGEQFAEGAHGMYLSKEGSHEYLFLTDIKRNAVYKCTLDGEIVLTLGVPDLPEVYVSPEKYRPTEVAVAPNGDIYVCDGYGQSWIHQYSANGERIRSWGGKGSEAGQMDCPHGIWIDTRGESHWLFVADRKNHRIQIFTLEGKHVKFIENDIDFPCSFDQCGDELYIADLHSRVSILDKNNQLIAHLGEGPEIWNVKKWNQVSLEQRKPDQFVAPHAVCVDLNKNLYVVEWVPGGRVTKLLRNVTTS